MATFRDRPYSQFNFLVNLGADPKAPQAGFQEVSGLGLEITVAEYRAGNKPDSAPDKITGMHKVPDVTLKRGVIGALDLHEWLKQVSDGAQAPSHRTVLIGLLDEARTGPVQQWKLTGARPIKYTGPSLTGKGTDVAIEELVLACERIDFV